MDEPVFLRALDPSDVERTYKWHNDSELYEFLGSPCFYISQSAEKSWIEQRCKYSDKEVNLAICIRGTNEHIGNIYLRNIEWINRNAELHIFIGEKSQQSRGLGSSAMRQLLTFAYKTLNLHRIYLKVLACNKTAIKMYLKYGFVSEGVFRQHIYKNGQYHDLAIMGLIKEPIEDNPK